MRPSRRIAIRKEGDATTVANSVQVAETSLRRAVGLLGRTTLGEEQGLWIKPCCGVHTVGMAFAIDVIGLDRQHRVVRLWRNLQPYRLTAIVPSVRSVLELPAGRIDRCDLHLGDQLYVQE